jgi:hypothetical protein
LKAVTGSRVAASVSAVAGLACLAFLATGLSVAMVVGERGVDALGEGEVLFGTVAALGVAASSAPAAIVGEDGSTEGSREGMSEVTVVSAGAGNWSLSAWPCSVSGGSEPSTSASFSRAASSRSLIFSGYP